MCRAYGATCVAYVRALVVGFDRDFVAIHFLSHGIFLPDPSCVLVGQPQHSELAGVSIYDSALSIANGMGLHTVVVGGWMLHNFRAWGAVFGGALGLGGMAAQMDAALRRWLLNGLIV